MYTASQKNTKLLFDISLIMEKFGTSSAGLDILHSFGQLTTSNNFKKKTKKELIKYDTRVKIIIDEAALIWIDNFAVFLKHMLLDVTDGSATSNQMSAIAFKKLPFSLKIPDDFEKMSWPNIPCPDVAKKHFKTQISDLWEQLKEKEFDVESLLELPDVFSVPMKAKVRFHFANFK